jgi:nucleotide-binding universal stress UspA family protein
MREGRGLAPNVASRADWEDWAVYREIVVGTDGSPTALHALDHAIHLAARETARLHIITAYRPLTPDDIYEHQRGLPPHERAEVDEAYVARSMLGAAAERAGEAGVPSQVYARLGDPAISSWSAIGAWRGASGSCWAASPSRSPTTVAATC